MYYFYCPNCNLEEINDCVPKNAIDNIRDGYGIPIYHYECPICHNLDAGAMLNQKDGKGEREYYQHVINMYQKIRGIKND